MAECEICARPMHPRSRSAPDPARMMCIACDGARCYRIVRHYFERPGYRRTIASGMTLREARAHCADPETSSSTATSPAARRRTRTIGAWFDGYTDK